MIGDRAEQVRPLVGDASCVHRFGAPEDRLDDDVVCIGRTDQHGCETEQLVGMGAPELVTRRCVGGVVDLERSTVRRRREDRRA